MTREFILERLYSENKITLEEYKILTQDSIDLSSQWKKDHEVLINKYEILGKMINESYINPLVKS